MEPKTTVLVVDDEPDILDLMRDFFEASGFQVVTAPDGVAALNMLETAAVDCLLLDLMMPGQTGFDVLRRVRQTNDVPVLFLSAREEDRDKIRGLGLGADDYIVKSATPSEIVARVNAVLRRYRAGRTPAPAHVEFGRVSMDLRAREVRVDGRLVPCTAREFDLLQLFTEHPRQVLTRDQLFERLWGPYGDRHTLTVHIGRLREKIEVNPAAPEYITTVWGVGYRFEGAERR